MFAALERINPHILLDALERAVHTVVTPEYPLLARNNRTFHKLLLEGAPVEYSIGNEKKTDHVPLVDFAKPHKNQFLAVNQFTITDTRQPRRPDVVVFINGLPIAVLELNTTAIF